MTKLEGKKLTKWDENKRAKLEQAAAIGCSWEEMAFYADISKSTLYNWLDTIDGLKERLDALKQKPILKARQTVVDGLDEVKDAQWYLERKRRKEFATRTENDTDLQVVSVAGFDFKPVIEQKDEASDKTDTNTDDSVGEAAG